MSRKSFLLGVVIALVLASAAAVMALLVEHEPEFYQKTALPPGKDRQQRSGKFLADFNQFCQEVQSSRSWSAHFEEDCINSFFDEHFVRTGFAEKILPDGISAPRIAIEPEKVRLAFRYGAGLLSTVISIDLRMWLAPKAPNVVAMELQGLHAGSLPIAAQSLLERVSEAARQNNIDVTWYRYNNNPVALLRFQADQDRPSLRLDHLSLQQGVLEIHGRSLEPIPLRAMLSLADPKSESN